MTPIETLLAAVVAPFLDVRLGLDADEADLIDAARRGVLRAIASPRPLPAPLLRDLVETEVRHAIALRHQGLVFAIARRYRGLGLDPLDLVGEGQLGLLRATELFDVTRQVRFSTYATRWVRQSIRRSVHERGPMVRVPANQRRLAEEAAADPTILDRLDRQVRDNLRLAIRALESRPQSGNSYSHWHRGWEPAAVATARASDDEPRPIRPGLLADLLGRIPNPRNRAIVESRFGLADREPLTLLAIGQRHNVTKERARQIVDQELRRMRSMVRARGIDFDQCFQEAI